MRNTKLSEIAEYIKERKQVLTSEVSKEFKISFPTIHRLFDKLSEQGEIKRVHGGAIFVFTDGESLFDKKLKEYHNQKKSICAYVAGNFIEDNEVICIDGGTTAYFLVDYLKTSNISILSNGIRTAEHAGEKLPKANVLCTGGSIRSQLSVCVGPYAIDFLHNRKIKTLILTCSGVDDVYASIYDLDPLIAEVKKAMISISQKIILLLTHNKFDNPAFTHFSGLNSIDHVICDYDTPAETVERYRNIVNDIRVAPKL